MAGDASSALLPQSARASLLTGMDVMAREDEDYHYAGSVAEFFGAVFVVAVIFALPAATLVYTRWPKSREVWRPRSARDINSAIMISSLLALCSLVLGVMGWITFLQCDYVSGSKSGGIVGKAGFGQIHVIGLAVALYLGPVVGILTLSATRLMLSQSNGSIPKKFKIGWLSLLVVGSCLATGVGFHIAKPVLGCGILWCTGVTVNTGTVLGGIGLWIFLLSAGFTAVFAILLVRSTLLGQAASPEGLAEMVRTSSSPWTRARDVERPRTSTPAVVVTGQAPPGSTPQTFRRQRAMRLAAALSLALIWLPFLWALSALLPNAFNQWMPSTVSASMAATAQAEGSSALFRTVHISLSKDYTIKAYPDTVLFYGFLEILALMAAASAAYPPLEKSLASRRYPRGMSLGEILTIALFVIMLVLWFVYWLQSHQYHSAKPTIDGNWLERIARTWGLTAVLFMALNLLPACKNSLWHKALGISWERGLWTHKWLGGAALVMMLLHILTMFCRYASMNSFPYDAIHLHQFYPINKKGVPVPGLPDYDNFTISTQMLVAYPALFIFGGLPLIRSKQWELFKYCHFFFLILIPATLLHAESSWYFLVGGIVFYLVDAGVRFVSITSPACVLSAKTYEAEGGVTELQISRAHPFPGQFAWVNVPAISTWEWHPFSLASSPYDGISKMCIKNMGKGTFTDKLYQLVHDGDAAALTVQFDGAYGPTFDPAGHAAVLLIGGGIGITQVHSTLRTLSQMAVREELPASLQLVRLIWIGRSLELFQVLDDCIGQCLQAEYPIGSPKFSAILHATAIETAGADEPSESSLSAPLVRGRPSFPQVYAEAEADLAALQPSEGALGTIFVQACGPAAMVSAAQEAAAGNGHIVFDSALFWL